MDRDGDGFTSAGGDCNDNVATIYPGATEFCSDNVDNNCDGQVDEVGCINSGVCTETDKAILQTCSITDITCINQTSAQCQSGLLSLYQCASDAGCDVDISGAEVCAYNNCTAEWESTFGVDSAPVQCNAGEVQSCGSDVGTCQSGTQTCSSSGTWGSCIGAVEPIPEVCGDLADNDCDGQADNFCPGTAECFVDADCAVGDACNTSFCSSGFCEVAQNPAGTACGVNGELCDAEGTCRAP